MFGRLDRQLPTSHHRTKLKRENPFRLRARLRTAGKQKGDLAAFANSLPILVVDDERVEADGKLHHLILNNKDRADMVHTIDTDFGQSLDDDKNATTIVNSAWVIK